MTTTQIEIVFGCKHSEAQSIFKDANIRKIMFELGCDYETAEVTFNQWNS